MALGGDAEFAVSKPSAAVRRFGPQGQRTSVADHTPAGGEMSSRAMP